MPSTRTLVATAVAAAGLAAGPLATAPAAPLSPAPARVMPATATDDCLAQGRVWLVVQDSEGALMHDTCVDKAPSGEALLTSAGVKLTKDAKGFICAMDSEPAKCPAKFDGNYWQYYTATPGGKWVYSTKGASDSRPAAGTLEGWCYGSKCTPAMPAMAASPAGSSPAPSAGASGNSSAAPSAASATPVTSTAPAAEDSADKGSGWGTLAAVAVVAGLAAAAYLALRRRKA